MVGTDAEPVLENGQGSGPQAKYPHTARVSENPPPVPNPTGNDSHCSVAGMGLWVPPPALLLLLCPLQAGWRWGIRTESPLGLGVTGARWVQVTAVYCMET